MDQLRTTAAHGVWKGGGAATWVPTRPFDWWRVGDLIEHLHAEPFDEGPLNLARPIYLDGQVAPFSRHAYPTLGLIMYRLLTAYEVTVLVLVSNEPPSRLTLWPVPVAVNA
jgi:hypothetical protein